jgi:hypothetical protein
VEATPSYIERWVWWTPFLNLAAPQRKVRQHNLAAPWSPARQDRTAALKFQGNQYGAVDPRGKNRAAQLLQIAAPSRMARKRYPSDVTSSTTW